MYLCILYLCICVFVFACSAGLQRSESDHASFESAGTEVGVFWSYNQPDLSRFSSQETDLGILVKGLCVPASPPICYSVFRKDPQTTRTSDQLTLMEEVAELHQDFASSSESEYKLKCCRTGYYAIGARNPDMKMNSL